MIMRSITTCLLLSLFSCLACGVLGAADKPNLIFILCDDLAMGDLGCYGQQLIKTPNLDRMAAEGTRYTQAYCGSSVCAPSRSSLMTGLHMGHCPIRGNRKAKAEGQLPLPESTITVAHLLKGAGYATACIGKWGMGMFDTSGSPLKKGFAHFFGYNCQLHAHDYFPTYLYDDDKRIELPENQGGKQVIYAQDRIDADVLRWVRAQKDHPFFLYYAITLPHGKFEIDDLGQYRDQPWTTEEKTYAAMVTRMDRDIGHLFDLLKELSLDQKTLVMMAGDNGSSFAPESPLAKRFAQASTGLRGFKRSLYEGGLRQAALARWPTTVPAARVSDEPWAFWDILPTFAELAGASVPASLTSDGRSLSVFLKGGAAPTRESFYWELHEGKTLQAVRFGDWKAVRQGPGQSLELYDLAKDPGERQNLASSHPDLVAKAEALITASRVESRDFPILAGKNIKTP